MMKSPSPDINNLYHWKIRVRSAVRMRYPYDRETLNPKGTGLRCAALSDGDYLGKRTQPKQHITSTSDKTSVRGESVSLINHNY